MALIPESSTHNKTNDSHAHTDFKEILKEKVHKNKVIKKVKNPLFVLICKLIFYLICLVSLYILGRKILEKYGFIIIPENENENKSSNNSRSLWSLIYLSDSLINLLSTVSKFIFFI